MKKFKIEKLNWDSVFFGFPVGKCHAEDFPENTDFEKMDIRPYTIVYLFSKNKLKLSRSIYEDVKVILDLSLENLKTHPSARIKPFKNKELVNLIHLAYQSGHLSRFKLDEKFYNYEFERLYFEWILKSVRREICDEVFVYEEQNVILGFVTVKIIDNIAQIGLIGVDTTCRGKGIGADLLNTAISFALSNQCTNFRIPTQGVNEAAIHFYKKHNFAELSKTYIYHIWNDTKDHI